MAPEATRPSSGSGAVRLGTITGSLSTNISPISNIRNTAETPGEPSTAKAVFSRPLT